MKVRNGFVSNSSSSSFVIHGVSYDYSDVEITDLMKKHLNEKQINDFEEGECAFEDLLSDLGLEIYEDYEGETLFFGKSWAHIGDDETGKQFKETIDKRLNEIFGKEVETGTIDTIIVG